nr:hypothetical protein CFP56_35262 [Quercus suber]
MEQNLGSQNPVDAPQASKDREEKKEGYGEWMVVAYRKTASKTNARVLRPETSDLAESIQHQSAKTDPRYSDHDRTEGKRKASQLQARDTLREAEKTLRSSRGKIGVARRLSGDGTSIKTKLKSKEIVGSQQDRVGPKFVEGTFGFGKHSGNLTTSGPNPSPFLFTSPSKPHVKTKGKGVGTTSGIRSLSHNGERREMGNLLQGEDYPNRGRDNQMDKTGSNGDLGVARNGFNGGLEESVSPHGDKQEIGLPSDEGRGLGDYPKPVVEIHSG